MADDGDIDKFIKVLNCISSSSVRYKCAGYFIQNTTLDSFYGWKYLEIIKLITEEILQSDSNSTENIDIDIL